MDVREDDVRVVLERVEHAVAVMRIDVHVGDALQPVALAQQLDRDAAIVEHAEPGGAIARGVMQPGDRHEAAPRLAAS